MGTAISHTKLSKHPNQAVLELRPWCNGGDGAQLVVLVMPMPCGVEVVLEYVGGDVCGAGGAGGAGSWCRLVVMWWCGV